MDASSQLLATVVPASLAVTQDSSQTPSTPSVTEVATPAIANVGQAYQSQKLPSGALMYGVPVVMGVTAALGSITGSAIIVGHFVPAGVTMAAAIGTACSLVAIGSTVIGSILIAIGIGVLTFYAIKSIENHRGIDMDLWSFKNSLTSFMGDYNDSLIEQIEAMKTQGKTNIRIQDGRVDHTLLHYFVYNLRNEILNSKDDDKVSKTKEVLEHLAMLYDEGFLAKDSDGASVLESLLEWHFVWHRGTTEALKQIVGFLLEKGVSTKDKSGTCLLETYATLGLIEVFCEKGKDFTEEDKAKVRGFLKGSGDFEWKASALVLLGETPAQ